MADSQRLLTKLPDVNVAKTWNRLLVNNLTEEEYAARKQKSEVAHTVVTFREPSPSHTPSEKTSSSTIKCEVCQSEMSLKGREGHQRINCSVCFEVTPLRPARSGFKYVRCLCNRITTMKKSMRWFLCDRPNCRRLVTLRRDNSILKTTQRYSVSVWKCYQCKDEYLTIEPSKKKLFEACPTCKTLSSARPTHLKVLMVIAAMCGLISVVGGSALIADKDRAVVFSWASVLYGAGMILLAIALRLCHLARRSEVTRTLHWEDVCKDDSKLLDEKIYFTEDTAIEKKQSNVRPTAVAPIIGSRELPPSYTPCTNIGNAWIKCEMCKSEMSLKGREDQWVINCSVCFEDTPLRPADSGFKYVRCLCNSISMHLDYCKGCLCTRPNCNRLLNRGPETSTQPIKHDRRTQYRCGQCHHKFFHDNYYSRLTGHVKCPTCLTVTSIRPTYTKIRAFLFLLIAHLCGIAGLLLSDCFNREMESFVFAIALCFASVYFLTTACRVYKNISYVVGHDESSKEKP